MNPSIQVFVFDAYGTLFDPHSIQTLGETLFPGHGAALSQLWRAKQLEYSWLRTLMHRYEDFWSVTRDALGFSCRSLQLPCTEKQRDSLLDAYLRLETSPEVKASLERLANRRLAILSNGSPNMLRAVVDSNGLSDTFECVLSVDTLKFYKPHPAVYQQAADQLKVPKEAVGFVSSNFWDVAGAASFGFQTFWVNRGDHTNCHTRNAHRLASDGRLSRCTRGRHRAHVTPGLNQNDPIRAPYRHLGLIVAH